MRSCAGSKRRGFGRRAAGPLIAAAMVASLGGCGSSSSGSSSGGTKGPIKIGAAIGVTGSMQPYDYEAYTTAEMAADDINAAGGIDGRKIQFVLTDMKSDPTLGPAAATQAISKGAQVMLVSCDFDMGSPAALTAQSKGEVALSLCAGAPEFGRLGPLTFSVGPGTPDSAAAVAQWAWSTKKWRKVYVLEDTSNEWARTYAGYFQEVWKHFGGTVVGKDTFSATDTTLSSQITRFKSLSQKADFIISATYPPQGPTMLRQFRAAGINTPIVSDSGMDGTFWTKAVPHLSNFYLGTFASIYGDDANALINRLVTGYKAKYHSAPLTSYFVNGYGDMELLADAIKEAGSTQGTKLAAVLQNFDGQVPALGRIQFTPKWHIALSRPWTIIQFQNGKPSFAARVSPSWVPSP